MLTETGKNGVSIVKIVDTERRIKMTKVIEGTDTEDGRMRISVVIRGKCRAFKEVFINEVL